MPKRKPAPKPVLRCPYTGEAFVEDVSRLGRAGGWTLSGGFDPAALTQDRAALERKLRSRDGVENRVKGRLVCAYRKTPVRIVEVSPGWFRAFGAWSPRKMFAEHSEMLYEVSIRDGVAPAFERRPSARIEVREVEPPGSNPAEGLGGSIEAVEEAVDRALHQPKSAVRT